jgi:hypothetical protein
MGKHIVHFDAGSREDVVRVVTTHWVEHRFDFRKWKKILRLYIRSIPAGTGSNLPLIQWKLGPLSDVK